MDPIKKDTYCVVDGLVSGEVTVYDSQLRDCPGFKITGQYTENPYLFCLDGEMDCLSIYLYASRDEAFRAFMHRENSGLMTVRYLEQIVKLLEKPQWTLHL